jgi:hypothetical protein
MHGSAHAFHHGQRFFRSRKPNAPIYKEHLANESDHNEHREEQNKNHPITFVMVNGVIVCFDSVRVRHTYLLCLVLLEPGTPDPHQAVGEESSSTPQQVTLYEVRMELLGFFVCQP